MSVHVGFIGRNGVAMLQRGDADVGAAVLRHVTRGDCEALRLGELVLRRVAEQRYVTADFVFTFCHVFVTICHGLLFEGCGSASQGYI